MLNDQLIVKYVSIQNCFVHLPQIWLHKSLKVGAIKVIDNGTDYYLSCANSHANISPPDFLSINATFAKSLNIKEGRYLTVSMIPDPPVLTFVSVSAQSEGDLEIIKFRASKIQLILLNQISIVAVGQPIVIWLSKGLHVTLFIDSVGSDFQYGKIEENTEVHVLDFVKTSEKLLEFVKPSPTIEKLKLPMPSDEMFQTCQRKNLTAVLRVCPMTKGILVPESFFTIAPPQFATLYLQLAQTRRLFPGKETCKFFLCSLRKLKNAAESSETPVNFGRMEDASEDLQERNVAVIVHDNVCEDSMEHFKTFGDNAIVSENLQTQMNLHLGDKIFLELTEAPPGESNVESTFSDTNSRLRDTSKFVFLQTLDSIIWECLSVFTMSLHSFYNHDYLYDRENVLICGAMGTGKTTICKELAQKLQEVPNFIYTQILDCKRLKGKKAETLNKLLLTAMNNCRYHQPSVLFLEDLESLTNNPSEEENTPDAMNASKIAETLIHIITNYQTTDWISVVATSTSMERLGSQLKGSRGANLFRTVCYIPVIPPEDRREFMKSSLKARLGNFVEEMISWEYYEEKTEGWVVQDIVNFIERAVFIAWKNKSHLGLLKEPLKLRNEELSQALSDSVPISLHGMKLYSGSGHNWTDIGGLKMVKECLVEILQWPLKYPGLYKMAPIRQQSGVLLYGMPGTGKTMLAGAIAKECGLHFINIKGPELLSKYIGASEEAVREIFQRAQRCKPCVLFFDEFDSLAPRRGHDSTGVTDRVVNQLLTQFDGVEGREGVAIVAASSRPDLLDPALLRPGRLDRSMLCPLPNENEREEILEALCRTHGFATPGLNLKLLATKTPGFTGADLNAILTQARLNAFEENWSTSMPAENIEITQDHLMESLEATQPSLSPGEIAKFNEIYRRFSKGDSFTQELVRHQKSTLA